MPRKMAYWEDTVSQSLNIDELTGKFGTNFALAGVAYALLDVAAAIRELASKER